jgi:superfamily II DNA or RNA helicase
VLFTTRTPKFTGSAAVFDADPALVWMQASKYPGEPPFAIYREDPETGEYLLPRNSCPLGPVDIRDPGLPVSFPNLKFIPRDEDQVRVVQETTHLLKAGSSFILRADTGRGKTAMSMPIIASTGVKTLIVAPKQDIFDAWVEHCETMLGLAPEQVGRIQANDVRVKDCPVVVSMLKSMSKPGRYPAHIFDGFGLLIVDEVHRVGTEHFQNVMWQVPAKLRLGLSATPKRRDGRDVVIQSHIGPILVTSDAVNLPFKVIELSSGWSVPNMGNTGKPIPHQPGMLGKVGKLLSNSPSRNNKICSLAQQAYNKDRYTVVFSEYRDHLKTMKTILIQMEVPEEDIGIYIGGLSKAQRAVQINKKIVLTTYRMTSEATNFPRWDTCIFAMPVAHIQQIVGRILRLHVDKKEPTVIDLVDGNSSILKGYRMARHKFYKSRNAVIHSI